jgi:spore coat protein SA
MHNEIKPYLPIINPLAVNLLNKADAIISVSKYLKKSILKKYPQVDPSKVYVLYNGSDVERFRPRNEEKLVNIRKRYGISANTNVILYVGRLIPEKGVHLLVNSFPFIKKDYNNVKLLIVGAPNFAVASETAYAHLLKANADKDVIFTGWIPEDILPYMYSLSDIFVFPAIWNDVSPLPIYEAQASGLPVISSNRGGIPEIIINNETGIIIEPNVKNLTDAVLALLHDESKRKKMGVNARKRAEEYYSWDRVATELQKIYRDIL